MEDVKWFLGAFTVARQPLDRPPPPHIPPQGWQILITQAWAPRSEMSLKSGCWQISLAEKELTTGSNCSGKQRQGVILNMQLSKKAVLISKKASLSSPYLHPWAHIHWATVTLIESAVKGKVKGGVRNFPYLSLYLCVWLAAGCQKVIFKACHLGKLMLAYTSPNVISTN